MAYGIPDFFFFDVLWPGIVWRCLEQCDCTTVRTLFPEVFLVIAEMKIRVFWDVSPHPLFKWSLTFPGVVSA